MPDKNMGEPSSGRPNRSLQARAISHRGFSLIRVTYGFPVLTTIGVYSKRADADLDREWFAANTYGSTYFVLERQ